jgi:hypothetical protein
VFLSYRANDTGDIIEKLAEELRRDLGRECVYRYVDDNVVGEHVTPKLQKELESSDGVVALIGPEWVGESEDGTLRIHAPEDLVRMEIMNALGDETKSTPLPVLVDISAHALKMQLGSDESDNAPWATLLDTHMLETTRDHLFDAEGLDYQRLLVGAWYSLADQIEDAVLIIGSHATAHLAEFLNKMKQGTAVEAKDLSQVGAHVYALSRKQLKKKAKRWPDVIVLVESTSDSRRFSSLMNALDEHPRAKTVSLVGVGVGAGVAGTLLVTGGFGSSGGTSVTAHAGAASMMKASSAAFMTGTTGLATAGVVASAAIGVGALIIWPDPDGLIEFENQSVDVSPASDLRDPDDRLYPFGEPESVEVEFGQEVMTEDIGALGPLDSGYALRTIIVKLPGEQPIELADVLLPRALDAELTGSGHEEKLIVAEEFIPVDLTYEILDPSNFCFETDDPETVTAGYRFTGEPGLVRVRVFVDAAGGATEASADVFLEAPAVRELLDGKSDVSDGARCLNEQNGAAFWDES